MTLDHLTINLPPGAGKMSVDASKTEFGSLRSVPAINSIQSGQLANALMAADARKPARSQATRAVG